MPVEKEPYTVDVCQGPECRQYGASELLNQLIQSGLPAKAGHCMGLCHCAPVVHLNQRCIAEATVEKTARGLRA